MIHVFTNDPAGSQSTAMEYVYETIPWPRQAFQDSTVVREEGVEFEFRKLRHASVDTPPRVVTGVLFPQGSTLVYAKERVHTGYLLHMPAPHHKRAQVVRDPVFPQISFWRTADDWDRWYLAHPNEYVHKDWNTFYTEDTWVAKLNREMERWNENSPPFPLVSLATLETWNSMQRGIAWIHYMEHACGFGTDIIQHLLRSRSDVKVGERVIQDRYMGEYKDIIDDRFRWNVYSVVVYTPRPHAVSVIVDNHKKCIHVADSHGATDHTQQLVNDIAELPGASAYRILLESGRIRGARGTLQHSPLQVCDSLCVYWSILTAVMHVHGYAVRKVTIPLWYLMSMHYWLAENYYRRDITDPATLLTKAKYSMYMEDIIGTVSVQTGPYMRCVISSHGDPTCGALDYEQIRWAGDQWIFVKMASWLNHLNDYNLESMYTVATEYGTVDAYKHGLWAHAENEQCTSARRMLVNIEEPVRLSDVARMLQEPTRMSTELLFRDRCLVGGWFGEVGFRHTESLICNLATVADMGRALHTYQEVWIFIWAYAESPPSSMMHRLGPGDVESMNEELHAIELKWYDV